MFRIIKMAPEAWKQHVQCPVHNSAPSLSLGFLLKNWFQFFKKKTKMWTIVITYVYKASSKMDQVMSQDRLSEFAVSNSHLTSVPQNNTSLFLMPSLRPSHPSLAFCSAPFSLMHSECRTLHLYVARLPKQTTTKLGKLHIEYQNFSLEMAGFTPVIFQWPKQDT